MGISLIKDSFFSTMYDAHSSWVRDACTAAEAAKFYSIITALASRQTSTGMQAIQRLSEASEAIKGNCGSVHNLVLPLFMEERARLEKLPRSLPEDSRLSPANKRARSSFDSQTYTKAVFSLIGGNALLLVDVVKKTPPSP